MKKIYQTVLKSIVMCGIICFLMTALSATLFAKPDTLNQIVAAMTSDTALPSLTARPQKVGGVKVPVMSLNGVWEFSAGKGIEFKSIQVPGEWAMQGFTVTDGEFATYRKSVTVPNDWNGKQIKLRFDAVHAVCIVSVNGKEAGRHEGGFVPFELDVTSLIKTGKNELTVAVQSDSWADMASQVSFYAAHPVGGILRKVTLFAVPKCYAASEVVTAVPQGENGNVHYQTQFVNDGNKEARYDVTLDVKDASGKKVCTETMSINAAAGQRTPCTAALTIENAAFWTSETPNLYTLEITLKSDGKIQSVHCIRFGIREIKVVGNRMLINGSPVKLFGMNRHEIHPLTGRSISPELCRKDAELCRAANMNCVRTSHYPPSEEFLEACDELGLFVECEAALCWVHNQKTKWPDYNTLDPNFLPYLLRPNLDQIAAYRNHPSIVMWSLGNESTWTPLWAKVLEASRKFDSSRPYLFHNQQGKSTGHDIANFHYPDERNPASWNDKGAPLWFGEYAHIEAYNRFELAADPGICEEWGRPFKRMVDLMWAQPGCLGGAIWSGIDDVFVLPNGKVCGYGHWGVYDGWRRLKPEYLAVHAAYSPFSIVKSEVAAEQPIKLTVQNRHNFLNLSADKIEWLCIKPGDADRGWLSRQWDGLFSASRTGIVEVDIAPHATGDVIIDEEFEIGDRVILTVTDPRGVEIAREQFIVERPVRHKKRIARNIQTISVDTEVLRMYNPFFQMPLPVPMVLPLNGGGGTQIQDNVVKPFTPIGEWTWHAESDGSFTGSGDVGSGKLWFEKQEDNAVKVCYQIKMKNVVNPRQWGMVFTLPRTMDNIWWVRKADRSWYPEDHIGRPYGRANAKPGIKDLIEEHVSEPKIPWSMDSNTLGTRDFRATRTNIRAALVSNEKKQGIRIRPAIKEDSLAVRTWVDLDCIRVLAAGFNTGGADRFFNIHYTAERRPLKKGDMIEGQFILEML